MSIFASLDILAIVKSILLGIVEGVTEFLPISSTGHLLLCNRWMNLRDDFWETFAIFIQIGAIASVVVYFRQRIWRLLAGGKPSPGEDHPPLSAGQRMRVILLIVLACLPLGIAYFADKWAEEHMHSPLNIAAALAIGGVVMILIELLVRRARTERMEHMSWWQALVVGLAQIVSAIFPGTSRSAATIMAGMASGMSRRAAAEFSFFLAIPAMSAACGYKLLKFIGNARITAEEVLLLAVGTLVSFVVAWAVIAAFMGYIRRHSFLPFAIYRIALAAAVWWVMRGGG